MNYINDNNLNKLYTSIVLREKLFSLSFVIQEIHLLPHVPKQLYPIEFITNETKIKLIISH